VSELQGIARFKFHEGSSRSSSACPLKPWRSCGPRTQHAATRHRVGAAAGPSEVLVSQTVKDLVAGSGLAFRDRGEHELESGSRPLAPLPGGGLM
jgi:hypothetical protein